MRKQQKIWQEEHNKTLTLPSLAADEPSSTVVVFREFLKKYGLNPPARVVDIGSGKGRNAIYLAKEGFEVYALDYIDQAINYTKQIASKENLLDKIHLSIHELDIIWPFEDNFFDLAIDCFSSIDIETKKGRGICRDEMYRTLRPNGLAMVSVVSAQDEIENELMKKSPGKENNSTYWPENKKFQKNYDEEELRNFYKDFTIIALNEIQKPAFKLGKNYTATNYWVVLQKP